MTAIVPEIFQSLLMTPSRLDWISNIDYVIFDEIQEIATKKEWLTTLSILPPKCQILCLSAAIGEPEKFLEQIQKLRPSNKFHFKHLSKRWTDIEKYVYHGLENNPKIETVHN